MHHYSLAHMSDEDLARDIAALVTRDRVGTALLLAHLAEFDARKLFRSAGYPSMFAYCVGALHFSEPGASKRIQAARAAKRFPILYPALAAGRLHLSAICLIAPHLNDQNAEELIEAATYRSKRDVESLVAARFPGALPEAGTLVTIRQVAPAPVAERTEPGLLFDTASSDEPCPEDVRCPEEGAPPSTGDDARAGECVPTRHKLRSPGNVKFGLPPENSEGETCSTHPGETQNEAKLAPGRLDTDDRAPASERPADVRAPASERFLVRLTIARGTHDKLREAQALLSHAVAPGDVAEVLDRALDMLLVYLKKRKVGASKDSGPSRASGPSSEPSARGGGPRDTQRGRSRYIPAPIRRAVWERDGGRCTFVSQDGHRCEERRLLEFDHIQPFALGGETTRENTRLRCRAHNQHEAERAFGAAFIRRKRRERG